LAQPQLLGATNTKCGVDNEKGLRGNKELGPDWLTEFISYMKSICQDWERRLFYIMHRNQHRVKGSEETVCSNKKRNLQKLIMMKWK